MACNQPLRGWRSISGGITFNTKTAYQGQRLEVPCGQCMGCRLAQTSTWATRIMHESMMHEISSFITLTYTDEELPNNQTLIKSDFQKFIKKLRKYLSPTRIRYYGCGEYGEKYQRPHYHAIIFGYWPDDTKVYKETETGILYYSPKLERIWGKGMITVGACVYETAAYTAKYITKKIKSNINLMEVHDHYFHRIPEFALMSRRPGIGETFYKKYKDQIWSTNTVVSRGREIAPPRYYKTLLKNEDYIKHFKLRAEAIRPPKVEDDRLATIEEYEKKKEKFFAKTIL